MDYAFEMRVVEIKAVHENSIYEHRIAQRERLRHADDEAIAGLERRQRSDSLMREFERGRGECYASAVEHEMRGALAHGVRNRRVGQTEGEIRELLRD